MSENIDLRVALDRLDGHERSLASLSSAQSGSDAAAARGPVSVGMWGSPNKPGLDALPSGTIKTSVTRHPVVGVDEAAMISLEFGNAAWALTTLGPNDVTIVDCAIAAPTNGRLFRVGFNGAKGITLTPGGYVRSDEVALLFEGGTDTVEVHTSFTGVARFTDYTLVGAINSSVTTLTLSAALPADMQDKEGYLLIGSEIIQYPAGMTTATLTGCTRGSSSAGVATTAASHSNGVTVAHCPSIPTSDISSAFEIGWYSAAGDVAMTAAPTNDGTNPHTLFAPTRVNASAISPTDKPCIFIQGDSNSAGQGDDDSTGPYAKDVDVGGGFVLRGIDNRWPYARACVAGISNTALAQPGDPAGSATATGHPSPYFRMAAGCTVALSLNCTNDGGTNQTGAEIYAIQENQARFLKLLIPDIIVIGGTWPPGPSSTDGYVTTANQTPWANDDTIRIPYNTLMRANDNGVFDWVYDRASAIECDVNGTLTLDGGYAICSGGATGTPSISGAHQTSFGHQQQGILLGECLDSVITGGLRGGITQADVTPPAPANTVAPALSGSTFTGQTLTCSTGTWTASPTGYAYQWKRAGTNISGATSSTYVLQVADESQSVKCTVTASNATGSTSHDSNTVTPTAAATAPGQVTGLTLTPGNAQLAASWTAPASNGGSAITDYKVEIRNPGGSGSYTIFSDGTSTTPSATITGLTNGTSVDVKVSAINAIGTGTPSSVVSDTPNASFDPASLSPLMWFKPSSFSAGADGDRITQWDDSSGNARHVTATSTARPTLKKAIVNSVDVVRFDGAANVLANTYVLAQPFEVWTVCKYASSGGEKVLWGRATAGGFEGMFYEGQGDGAVRLYFGTANVDSATSQPVTAWHVWRAFVSGASSLIDRDSTNVAAAGTDPGTNGVPGGFAIGSAATAYFSDFDVAEIIVTPALNTTQRNNLRSYFSTKYATP